MVCMAFFTYLGTKSNQLLEQIDEAVLRLVNFLGSQQKTRPDRPYMPPHIP
jgi:hypothetical protein